VVTASSPTWETLEAFARQSMQQFLQRTLEAEVDELLARGRYERRAAVDAPVGYRNGFGKSRRLSLSNGTITLRRPRVRGVNERFESRLLPAFKRRTEEVGRLLPDLYLHGLAQGDFDLALRGLLGEGAPLSAPSIARLKAGWQAEYDLWKTRSVAELQVVYLWVDGVYVKAGLEKDEAAILVVLAALRDGQKVILAVESGYRESTESWAAILRDLKRRPAPPRQTEALSSRTSRSRPLETSQPSGARAKNERSESVQACTTPSHAPDLPGRTRGDRGQDDGRATNVQGLDPAERARWVTSL